MTLVIAVDRIEGPMAVLDVDGTTVDWPLAALPAGTREGARLSVTFAPAPADTAEAEARLARLKSRTPQSGDIDL